MCMSSRYIVGDWGSTRLRLYLIEQEQVVAQCEGPGISFLKSPAAESLAAAVRPWLDQSPSLELILGGMASSRGGLRELAYVRAPAGSGDWLRGARRLSVGPLSVLLATGVQCGNPSDGYEVMRGEEAQTFGAIELNPHLASNPQRLVLPGTHTKWVDVTDSVITQFRTAITGELYALLREHSSLLNANLEQQEKNSQEFDHGFSAGNLHATAKNGGLLTSLFQTRTEQLLQDRTHSWASGFLSGLLISHELATMRGSVADVRPVTIIGAPAIALLYQRVFKAAGIPAGVLDGAECARRGLRLLREQHQ